MINNCSVTTIKNLSQTEPVNDNAMQWWWEEANQSDSHNPRLLVMVRWSFQHCLIYRTCWTVGRSQIAIIQVCLWSKSWSNCLLKYSQSSKININITNISNLLTQNNPPVILVVLWVCGEVKIVISTNK